MIISLDLWGTLIKSSPNFKVVKANFVREFFNVNYSDEEVEKAFYQTKLHFNSIIEVTGWQPNTEQILRVLFSNLGINYNRFTDKQAISFYRMYQELAINNPPIIYSNDTIQGLRDLVQEGNTLKLSSNTMFINGESLKIILKSLGLVYCTFHYFSDMMGYAKPHPGMYTTSNFHIGDNVLTDKYGPEKLGIPSFIINSNDKTLTDAVNYILNK